MGRPDTLGVLGGMGPLATADFLVKLVRATPVRAEQDHVPVILASLPQIPDRQAAARGQGPSPAPAMIAVRRLLEGAGARCLAMPCHSAHLWYDEVAAGSSVPFLHIADAVRDALGDRRQIGVVAAPATLDTRLYPIRLEAAGMRCLELSGEARSALVEAIARIKVGDYRGAAPLLGHAVADQLDRGAEAVVLACTELPLALPYLPAELRATSLDATAALAEACVRWARSEAVQGE